MAKEELNCVQVELLPLKKKKKLLYKPLNSSPIPQPTAISSTEDYITSTLEVS